MVIAGANASGVIDGPYSRVWCGPPDVLCTRRNGSAVVACSSVGAPDAGGVTVAPLPLLSIPAGSLHIVLGTGFACAQSADGAVRCDAHDGAAPAYAPQSPMVAIASNGSAVCGVLCDGGAVVCWTPLAAAPPVRAAQIGAVDSVCVGAAFVCGGRSAGGSVDAPVTCHGAVGGLTGGFVQITCGGSHVCGVAASGAVACSGGAELVPTC